MSSSYFGNTIKRILVIAGIAGIFGFGGYRIGKSSDPFWDVSVPGESSERNLRLCVMADEKAGFTSIPAEGLEENGEKITCLGIRNVTIDWDGAVLNLEDALRKGYVSTNQMISWARMDAEMGVCEEIPESKNGLARFTYRYPDYDLVYIFDIYETPDGKQHLISEFAICDTGRTPSFFYMDEETGKPIDYENWGLHFEVLEASSGGITMHCTQSGGQQMGTLMIRQYNLYRKHSETEEVLIEPLFDEFLGESNPNIPIKEEDVTKFSIDFSGLYEGLSCGDYVIYLIIDDQYSVDSVPSLMRNYRDEQLFGVEFTISD